LHIALDIFKILEVNILLEATNLLFWN